MDDPRKEEKKMTLEEQARNLAEWLACEYGEDADSEYTEIMKDPRKAGILYTELQGDLKDAEGYEPYDIQAYLDLTTDEVLLEIDGELLPIRGKGYGYITENDAWMVDYDCLYADFLDLAEDSGLYERVWD